MGRVLTYAVTLWAVVTLNFLLPRLLPGDPFLWLSGEAGEEVAVLTEEQHRVLMARYGLDRPLPEQYRRYLAGLARGDLGFSIYYREPVAALVGRRLPWSLLVVGGATLLSLGVGVALGAASVWRRGRLLDRSLLVGLLVVGEIPAFLVGMVLLVGLAGVLGWFPLGGARTPFAGPVPPWQAVADVLHHAALPVAALAISQLGGFYLLSRNSLVTVLAKDFIRTARAKGVPERLVRDRHALRNALLPIVTRGAMQFGAAVGGSVLVENVFAYPGVGRLMGEALAVRDYPLLQGTFLVLAVAVMGANLAADLVYRWLDPRVGSGGEPGGR